MRQIFTIITLVLTLNLSGQNINLDSSFGTNGIKKIEVDGESDDLKLLDIDNNSFLIFSKVYIPNSNVVYKLNTDGSLNNNFGVNGKLLLPNYSGEFKLYNHVNNKFIVVFSQVLSFGSTNNERAIIRYNSDGSLDTSYGVNGEVRIQIGDSDGSGNDKLVILSDNSLLFSDPQRFIKYSINGVIDNSFGTNGILAVNHIGYGNMQNSYDGNLLFHNSLNIEKRDYNGNLVNTFGVNGAYSFPVQNDYIVKARANKLSFMEYGNGPVKFYDLNNNGTLNTSFNATGSIDLTKDNGTLDYYEDFNFYNGIFYFVGETNDYKPFIVCYDASGTLIPLNNADSYTENLVSSAYFSSMLMKDNYMYAGGDSYDDVDKKWSFIIAKYTYSNLSTNKVEIQNQLTYNNPVTNELKITAKSDINSIEIFNLVGQKLKHSNSSTVDISSFKKGVYMAKIEFKNGGMKIIKLLKK